MMTGIYGYDMIHTRLEIFGCRLYRCGVRKHLMNRDAHSDAILRAPPHVLHRNQGVTADEL